jgi:hypothetical protein
MTDSASLIIRYSVSKWGHGLHHVALVAAVNFRHQVQGSSTAGVVTGSALFKPQARMRHNRPFAAVGTAAIQSLAWPKGKIIV